jgi:hypothetical protein
MSFPPPPPAQAIPAVAKPIMVLLGCIALFAACARERDTFNPQIVITDPVGGVVTKDKQLTVRGYAWDDRGVEHLFVTGASTPVDLLAEPAFSKERGKKVVPFEFLASAKATGKVAYALRAVDLEGREGRRELELTVDTTPPKLQFRLEGRERTVAVVGKASDNQKVVQVLVNGEPANVPPGSEVDFYVEVRRSARITIVAQDGAGNTTKEVRDSPAAPAPVIQPAPVQPTTLRPRRRLRRSITPAPQLGPGQQAPVTLPTPRRR